MRAHPFFHISETAGLVALKFGTYVVRDPSAKRFTKVEGGAQLYERTCARVDVLPFPYLVDGWTDHAEFGVWLVDLYANACCTEWEIYALAHM